MNASHASVPQVIDAKESKYIFFRPSIIGRKISRDAHKRNGSTYGCMLCIETIPTDWAFSNLT